jgi:hypothetical protein
MWWRVVTVMKENNREAFEVAADALYNELVRLYAIEWEKLPGG